MLVPLFNLFTISINFVPFNHKKLISRVFCHFSSIFIYLTVLFYHKI
ncbi:conserved domain protein, partial [Listeria seeligeri FSL N1-067]